LTPLLTVAATCAHPTEALDRRDEEASRAEQRERLTEIKEHALALKEKRSGGEIK
jgi:hypothetical protein